MDDANIFISQHHSILFRIREGGINLRMSIVMVARQIQRLLVQWGSHSTIHLVSYRQFDGFLDVLESGIATL